MHRDAEEMRADAERAHREADEESFGRLGRPMRRDSPFMLGFLGALGVFLAWFLTQALVQARSVIILIVVSLFLAVGLNPVVESLTRRGMRRTFAIAIVFLVVIGAFVGFGFAVVPPVVEQSNEFVQGAARATSTTCAATRRSASSTTTTASSRRPRTTSPAATSASGSSAA